MKTLRMLRNIAVLFVLAMAFLASKSSVGVAHAASGKSCGYKLGHNCWIDASGNCRESGCNKGDIFGCPNSGCM